MVCWSGSRSAKTHKTFAVWAQFVLEDYPAYLTFRIALRTGDFKLRCAALRRRIAPIFYITGKDRYQWLIADHLAELARMTESDWKVMSELFSVQLGKDAYARIGMDERQEVANLLYKTLTKRIQASIMDSMAPTAQLRDVATLEFERHFIEGPRTERDRKRELARLRGPAVKKARECLRGCPAFKDGVGEKTVMSLDGRVACVDGAVQRHPRGAMCG